MNVVPVLPAGSSVFKSVRTVTTYAVLHAKCRDGEQCSGPGCKVYTGKTERRRYRGRTR